MRLGNVFLVAGELGLACLIALLATFMAVVVTDSDVSVNPAPLFAGYIVVVLAVQWLLVARFEYVFFLRRWNGRRWERWCVVRGLIADGAAMVMLPGNRPLSEGQYRGWFLQRLDRRGVLVKICQIQGSDEKVIFDLEKAKAEYAFRVEVLPQEMSAMEHEPAPGPKEEPEIEAPTMPEPEPECAIPLREEALAGTEEIEREDISLIMEAVFGKAEKKEQKKGRPRRTHAEYAALLAKRSPEIELLGEYTGAGRTIDVRCRECGRQWKGNPSMLLKEGCRYCREEGLYSATP